MPIIYLIAFVSTVGVGIIVPLFPFFGERVGASAEMITSSMGIYALGQLISTPVWGWLSDRIGRKPVFLLSLAGATVSYVLLAFADSVAWLLMSRLLAGLMTGIGAAVFAAVTDLTEPGPRRAKYMGRVGASVGIGFMAGPALGGLLAGSNPATADFTLIALVAGGMDVAAFVIAAALFAESLPEASRNMRPMGGGINWERPKRFLSHTPFVALGIAHLLFSGAYSIVDSTFPLFANRAHGLNPQEIGYLFTWMATASALTQIILVERLVRMLGDQGAVLFGICGYFIAFSVIAYATSVVGLAAGLTCTSFAWAGFLGPSSNLVAAMAQADERGLALGLFQAFGNIGRTLTPVMSGVLFAHMGMASPFVLAALMMIPAFYCGWLAKPLPPPVADASDKHA